MFVKQRRARAVRTVVDTMQIAFAPTTTAGLSQALLHDDPFGHVALLRFDPGTVIAHHAHALGEEFFVLSGELRDELGTYTERCWVRQPPGSAHTIYSDAGCLTFAVADHLSPPPARVAPGSMLGPFRVDAILSQGPRCCVVAATQPDRGRRVAIKVLTAGGARRADLARRFMFEAQVLAKLGGQHTVGLLDFGKLETDHPYSVMELLEGETLATRGALAPALAVEYVAQACRALERVHALHIVHRDVKPANLFRTTQPDGTPLVKLISFGVALQLPVRFPRANGLTGSPAYMSPEQIAGSRDVDARADLWSLGVTLYQLLTGRLPFRAATIPALVLQIATEPHVPSADIPPALAAVIDRCLGKDRASRFATAVELADALRATSR